MIPNLELTGEGGRLLLSLFGVAIEGKSVQAEIFCLHALPRAKEPLFLDGKPFKLNTLLEQRRLGLICFSALEGVFLNVPKRRKNKESAVHL